MAGRRDDEQPGPGGLDPVPESALKRAREAFSQRSAGPVANLASDSLIERGDPAGAHLLVFEAGTIRIELRVAAAEAQTSVEGTLHGLAASKAMLHLEGSELALVAPMNGESFGFEPLAHGVVRLSFEAEGGSSLWSDWFQI
jgi:hypothetical protein